MPANNFHVSVPTCWVTKKIGTFTDHIRLKIDFIGFRCFNIYNSALSANRCLNTTNFDGHLVDWFFYYFGFFISLRNKPEGEHIETQSI